MRNGSIKDSLHSVIVALCADYGRRKEAIEKRLAPHRVDTEMRYYNFKMFDAAAEIVGDEKAEQFIREIGESIGYAYSSIEGISETTYKKYKKLVVENITRALHLA